MGSVPPRGRVLTKAGGVNVWKWRRGPREEPTLPARRGVCVDLPDAARAKQQQLPPRGEAPRKPGWASCRAASLKQKARSQATPPAPGGVRSELPGQLSSRPEEQGGDCVPSAVLACRDPFLRQVRRPLSSCWPAGQLQTQLWGQIDSASLSPLSARFSGQ